MPYTPIRHHIPRHLDKSPHSLTTTPIACWQPGIGQWSEGWLGAHEARNSRHWRSLRHREWVGSSTSFSWCCICLVLARPSSRCNACLPARKYCGLKQNATCSTNMYVCSGGQLTESFANDLKKLKVTDMKMCRWACGHTVSDHVRNDNTRERLNVENVTDRCRKTRLRWFGHVKRRGQEYVGTKDLEMVPRGRRQIKRPNQKWVDSIDRDLRAIGTTKHDVDDRSGCRRIASGSVTPQLSGSG